MFSCGGLCSAQNRETDTVTLTLPPRFQEEEEDEAAATGKATEEEEVTSTKWIAEKWLHLSEEIVAMQNKAAVEQWKKHKVEAEEAEMLARREEEALRLAQQEQAAADEEEARRQAEEARRVAEEAEEAEKAAAAAAAAAAAEEAEKAAAAAAAARKAAVQAFLKEHGYAGPAAPKRTLMKTTYPLHEAAKLGDAKMVTMLLEEGASQTQKNSRGKTALQRAQQADRKGSHAQVIQLLGGKAQAQAGKAGGA